MMNISLGQFFPAKSPIHRLDPRMKIVMGFLYIICAFLCRNVFSFLLLIASILLLMILSRIPVKIYLREGFFVSNFVSFISKIIL